MEKKEVEKGFEVTDLCIERPAQKMLRTNQLF